jgi:hypothetical protein
MTDHMATHSETTTRDFSLRAWIWANVAGLGVAYGLFGLFGGFVEFGLGFAHDSIVRDLALLVAFLVGATVFVTLRRRELGPHVENSTWVAIAAGIGLAAGFVIGFVVAGPPVDFVLGVIALGTIGGALQWRVLRNDVERPGGLLWANIGGWLAAGVAVAVVAIVAGDAIHQLLGAPEDGTVPGVVLFASFLALLGVVGGAVGGSIEGAALRRRL